MAKLPRVTAKIFAENAPAEQVGQFGSALAGTKVNTTDIAQIQALPAYENGWRAAVLSSRNYPTLEETNGVQKVMSQQTAYTLQQGIPEYDIGTEYYIGSIVKDLDQQGTPILYYSLTDNNKGNPLTDVTNWSELSLGGGGLEVCDIGMSLYVDESKGLRRYLNGQIVSINANTQFFLNRLKQIVALYPSLATTEENWQAEKTASAFGQVGRFVIADDESSVRLPAIVNVQGLLDMQNLGMTVAAGLPNITGSVNGPGAAGANIYTSPTGAFQTNNAYHYYSATGAAVTDSFILNIDASRSNSIYGNSETVQEEAVQYPYFIQIATGQETEANITNTLESNIPHTMFESKYSPIILDNLSWLRSNGQWNPKSVYQEQYEALQVEQNSNIADGESVTLPSGGTYVKVGVSGGLSCVLSTETYTDYDFVLNTSDETFRLPLRSKLASGKAVVGNGKSLAITDGDQICGIKLNTNTVYHLLPTIPVGQEVGVTASIDFTVSDNNIVFGVPTAEQLNNDLENSGIETSDQGLYLYYYMGNGIQNANLINAGRIEEQLVNKLGRNNKEEITSWAIPDYSAGVDISSVFTNSGTYTFPTAGIITGLVDLNTSTPIRNTAFINGSPIFGGYQHMVPAFGVVDKNDILSVTTNYESDTKMYFYPLKGAN